MITLAPLTDKKSVRAAWEQNGLTYSDISGCVEARCGDEALGYCLYTLDVLDLKLVNFHCHLAFLLLPPYNEGGKLFLFLDLSQLPLPGSFFM